MLESLGIAENPNKEQSGNGKVPDVILSSSQHHWSRQEFLKNEKKGTSVQNVEGMSSSDVHEKLLELISESNERFHNALHQER